MPRRRFCVHAPMDDAKIVVGRGRSRQTPARRTSYWYVDETSTPLGRIFLTFRTQRLCWRDSCEGFTCLTVGDTIVLPYNKKKYHIDVLEAKPMAAICVIETDCEVDFALPLDSKEPEHVASLPIAS